MCAAAGRVVHGLVQFVAEEVLVLEFIAGGIGPRDIRAVILAQDEDGPAQLLARGQPRPRLGVADKILKRIVLVADVELAVRRHSPLRQFGDELVLVPLANAAPGHGQDIKPVCHGDEFHAADREVVANVIERVHPLACRGIEQCDIGTHAENAVKNGPEGVRREQVAATDVIQGGLDAVFETGGRRGQRVERDDVLLGDGGNSHGPPGRQVALGSTADADACGGKEEKEKKSVVHHLRDGPQITAMILRGSGG